MTGKVSSEVFHRMFLVLRRVFLHEKLTSEDIYRAFLALLTSFLGRHPSFSGQTSTYDVLFAPFLGLPSTKRFFNSSNRG
jgi:hypothetical protein